MRWTVRNGWGSRLAGLAWLLGVLALLALAWPFAQWSASGVLELVRRDGEALAPILLSLTLLLGLLLLGGTAMMVRRLERRRLSLQQRATLLDHAEQLAQIGCAEIDLMTDEVSWSAGMYRLLSEPVDARPRRLDWLDRHVPESERDLVRSLSHSVSADAPCEFQHRLLRADGTLRTVLHRSMLEVDAKGWPRRMLTLLQDITEQRDAEKRIDRLANCCETTGLPNRKGLLDALDAELHRMRHAGGWLALLDLSVDQLELVTHSLGFDAAERLLIGAAERLGGALPAGSQLAHLGSGEFAVLVSSPECPLDEVHALDLAEHLSSTFAKPVQLDGREVQVGCAIGLSLSPRDSDQPQRLLQQAQAAQSRARESGRNRIAAFTAATHERAAARLELEMALRRALQREEFSLCFQPQLDLQTGEVCGAEALLRWADPQRGMVSPALFIPLAEELGLIVEIGEWVLRKACQQNVEWQRAGLRAVRMSVNISGRQLQQNDIAWRIQSILMECGMDPRYLALEITESVLVDESDHIARVLNTLRSIGIELALDDFGTGYSNLGYLRRLPLNVLKIDRSIVHDIAAGEQEVSMSRAVINLAHGLKLKVLAEGVESEGQLALLMAARCDQMQGHYFSPAVAADEFAALLAEGRRLPEHMFQKQRERTLLLVDDEENILAALKRLLRRDGYRIVTATSGAQGLQRLSEQSVDVIVSDQRMPGMTGVEFLRRAKDLYPDTVRMVLSGYTELQSITDAVNEGAIYKFLTKPWDDERLRVHIDEAFRSKELADENVRLAAAVSVANQELAQVNQRLEKLLQRQHQRISQEEASLQIVREVLETIPAALLGIDRSGLLVYSNTAADQILGSDTGLLGLDAGQVLPEALQRLWLAGDDQEQRVQLGGRPYLASCRPMLDGSEQTRGHLLVLTRSSQPDREISQDGHQAMHA